MIYIYDIYIYIIYIYVYIYISHINIKLDGLRLLNNHIWRAHKLHYHYHILIQGISLFSIVRSCNIPINPFKSFEHLYTSYTSYTYIIFF